MRILLAAALLACWAPVRAVELAPMPPQLLASLRTFFATDFGARLIALDPSLAALNRPRAQDALGARTLSALAARLAAKPDFVAALADPARRELAAAQLLTASHEVRGEAAVTQAQRMAAALSEEEKSAGAAKVEWIPVLSLRPMQFEVGMREVAEKAQALRAMTAAERRAYLLAHAIPVIRRRGGERHVDKSRVDDHPDDHHHLSRAAWEAGVAQIPIDVKEEVDAPTKHARKKFWKRMRREKLVYLRDRFGNVHEPEDLPLDVRGLADDPYRSLAGKVRDLGGYEKTSVPFAEFQWANFFREHVRAHPNDDFERAVKQALKLARDPRAKGLPGYVGRKKKK